MKIIITKIIGRFHDHNEIKTVHLIGALDSTACGLALEDFDYNSTTKNITCETCLTFLKWARIVYKIKS